MAWFWPEIEEHAATLYPTGKNSRLIRESAAFDTGKSQALNAARNPEQVSGHLRTQSWAQINRLTFHVLARSTFSC